MRIGPRIATALIGVSFAAFPAELRLEGRYEGTYSLDQIHQVRAGLVVKGDRKFSGELTFRGFKSPDSFELSDFAFSFSGVLDRRSLQLHIVPKAWLTPPPALLVNGQSKPAPLPYEFYGSVRPDGLILNDSNVNFAPVGSTLAGELRRRADVWELSYLRERTPPERRPSVTNLAADPWSRDFEYVDDVLLGKGQTDAGIAPIDRVMEAIKGRDLKCLATYNVSWTGKNGTARGRHFGAKTYVIECQGDCRGLHYRPDGVGGESSHYGITTAVPVIRIISALFASYEFTWRFTMPGSSNQAPRVRIHAWTSDPDDKGPGCQLFQ